MMNRADRSNLEALQTMSPEEFEDWLCEASDSDLTYAAQIMISRMMEIDATEALLDIAEGRTGPVSPGAVLMTGSATLQ